jgi:VanZ family protein
LVTLTLERGETRVYVDGVLRKAVRDFPLSARHMTGQLVVGTDPFGDDSWAGEIRYLALLNRALSRQEAQERAVAKRRRGEIAVYLFDEGSGRRARNALGGGPDLVAPEQYTIPQKTLLEIPRKGHWDDLILNIGGFVPFGVCFYALFSSSGRLARAAPAITILSGTLLSLTVEILQVFVPERDSDAADVVTNTLGAVLGVILYRRCAPRVTELLSRYRGALDSRPAT